MGFVTTLDKFEHYRRGEVIEVADISDEPPRKYRIFDIMKNPNGTVSFTVREEFPPALKNHMLGNPVLNFLEGVLS